MKKVIALISGLVLSFQASLAYLPEVIVVAASPPQQPKSFAEWCQQKESVPADTRHTVDVLLKEAGTNNCKQADTKFRNLTELALRYNPIIDVKPLAGLTNLTGLNLQINQIVSSKTRNYLSILSVIVLF
jgi:internalin A